MLKNKVVLITGAGSGLGRALANAFCLNGAIVIGLGRSLQSLQETDLFIKQNGSQAFHFYQTDISNNLEVDKTIQAIIERHHNIDYVFNNAAVYPKINFLEQSEADFTQALTINVIGTANICRAVLPIMIKQQTGVIFNVGSFADLSPANDSAAYSASKGAVRALTKAIAADISHINHNIQVHEWIPGHVNTQMSNHTGLDPNIPANWAVGLTKLENKKKNCIYLENHEWLPPKSFKEKLKSKLFFWEKH